MFLDRISFLLYPALKRFCLPVASRKAKNNLFQLTKIPCRRATFMSEYNTASLQLQGASSAFGGKL